MNRKKIRLCAVLCLAAVAGWCLTPQVCAAKSTNYAVDGYGNLIPIPQAYEVETSIKNLGGYGFLTHPEDIFVDANGLIYIADTGNNRILKLTGEGKVMLEITEAFGKALNGPKGVYVHTDGSIWVVDTGNQRIAVLEKDGAERKEYGKPESKLLESNFTFDVEKIYVNQMGYLFALKGANIMRIDSANQFQGYMGATEVGFSLQRFLIRTFGSKDQIERTVKLKPASYKNFMIGSDGSIYGVLASGTSGQIRRLNSVGENTYVDQAFGFNIYKEGEALPITPSFSDITVFDSGIITVIDRWTGMLYQYDPDGNLLTSFGGIGDSKELFQVPTGIASDSEENLYVLDYSTGAIKIFSPTSFIDTVHQAIVYQRDGNYDMEKQCWEKVLELDSNYSLAHKGLGKIAYKAGEWEESMRQYRLGEDRAGYSLSFSEHRHEIFRNQFGWVLLAAAVLIYGGGKLFAVVKRKSDLWCYQIEMKGELE